MVSIRRLCYIAAGLCFAYAAYIGISLLFLPSVESLKNRRTSLTIRVKDWQGNYRPFVVGPKNPNWTPGGAIPDEMKWAVVVAEDSNFYKHEGVDVKALKRAIKYDLEKKSMARGASTITQQVAKNLFLSREKTISRKVKELILAKRMESLLTKGRIIELYLNVIELGPMVYGIGHGSRYYFGKGAGELTPRECAFLAAMLPGPRVAYNPYRNLDKVLKRADGILGQLRKRGVLSEEEYQAALAQPLNIAGLQQKVDESIKREEAFPNRTGAIGGVLPTTPPPEEKQNGPATSPPEAPAPATPPPSPPAAPAAEQHPPR